MQSLLGQFYNRIKGSQEDIASEGLTYILKKSKESRDVINQIIKINTGLKFSDIIYSTQNVGENNERPDISGIDNSGKEVLLIEAKFWASLTHNQPNGYLERLDNNTVLVFLVPTLRSRTVFNEIRNRVSEKYQNIIINSDNHIIIESSKKHILIKSWDEILRLIKSKLEQYNKQTLISDVNQIIGLCETIDKNAFQPITDIDLSPRIPKSINSYYEIVDKVVDELKNRNKDISINGLNKTTQRYGYHRYFQTTEFGLTFALKLNLWDRYADTPFWFSVKEIKGKKWTHTERIKKSIELVCAKKNYFSVPHTADNKYFIGLKPKLHETEDVVIADLANQIELIIKEITNANKKYS